MDSLLAIANTSYLCNTEQNPQSGLPKVHRGAVGKVRRSSVKFVHSFLPPFDRPIKLGSSKRFSWEGVMTWLGL